jgi:autotransporter-associated beta strand protein
MNKSILVSISWVFLAAYPVLGNPTISIDTQYMLNTNAERRIPIYVSSAAEQIEGVNLAVQIGDGGAVNGGVNTAPRIINLDVIGSGTIFNPNNTGNGTLPDGTPLPVYIGSGGNNLIGLTETTANLNTSVNANGVLGYLTVNPAGAAIGTYQIKLLDVGNVADGDLDNDPWDTDFAGIPAFFSGNSNIQIVALHPSVWNAGANGVWTNPTWTNPQPPYPNYTTQAILNTNYTVSVTGAQEADSLAISSGNVSIGSAGSLAVTNAVTVSSGGTLTVASGYGLSATGITLSGGTLAGSGTIDETIAFTGGTLSTPAGGDNLVLTAPLGGTGGLAKTGPGTATLSANANYAGTTTLSGGRLQLNGANSSLDAISGTGTLGVGNGTVASILTADSINAGTLTIAAGSKVVINPLPGSAPLAGSAALTVVPEPSTFTLLIVAALGMFLYRKIR